MSHIYTTLSHYIRVVTYIYNIITLYQSGDIYILHYHTISEWWHIYTTLSYEGSDIKIKNVQSRETGNIGNTRRRQTKHYMQTNTNNINKTWAPYKQLEVKTNRTSFLCGNRNVKKQSILDSIMHMFCLFTHVKIRRNLNCKTMLVIG
jgi:hypothetical protein